MVGPRKGKKKKRSEGEEPKKKKGKKQKTDKVTGLKSYTEASGKGTSAQTSSGISSSIQVDTIPIPSFKTSQQTQPPHSHQTTQIPTPIPSQPIITLPSESSELILYEPQPHNLLYCIILFGYNASKQVSELMASTSTNPIAVRKNWEEFQKWMQSTFKYMHHFSETDKQASIQAASARKEAYEHSLAARLAEQRRIAEERIALDEAEKSEFLRAEA
jgi:hypothetical protein